MTLLIVMLIYLHVINNRLVLPPGHSYGGKNKCDIISGGDWKIAAPSFVGLAMTT
jgi:hypothetical protein